MDNFNIEEIYAKIDSLNRASYQIRFSDVNQGVQQSQEALNLNKLLNQADQYLKGLADTLNNLTWFKLRLLIKNV